MDELQCMTLETPCIVIDAAVAQRNIERMQQSAYACNCNVRPHIKTHKMPMFMKRQIAAGACGITCAKVSEAEIMADAGAQDIFIAYPAIGEPRIRRIISLAKRIPRFILCVDSEVGAAMLNERAAEENITLEVRIEIDTGLRRTGVAMTEAVRLAQIVHAMSHLTVTGIFTYKSMVLAGEKTLDVQAAAEEEGQLLASVAAAMRDAGIAVKDISAGSTPTGLRVANTGLVTEIRPGTYIFGDYALYREGVMSFSDLAARLYATVVSVAEDHAVIDGGSKTFPMDIALEKPMYFFESYVHFVGHEELVLTRMNEEHGMVVSKTGAHNLQIGQVLEMIPLHVCTAINMQNDVYILEEGVLRKEKVAARGMLL